MNENSSRGDEEGDRRGERRGGRAALRVAVRLRAGGSAGLAPRPRGAAESFGAGAAAAR